MRTTRILMYVAQMLCRTWKKCLLYVTVFVIIITVIEISGILRHALELDYEHEFSYPMDLPDFPEFIYKYRNNESVSVKPINTLHKIVNFRVTAESGCIGEVLPLIILIKSAGINFKKRATVRSTWGNVDQTNKFGIKIVFLLGQVRNPTQLTSELNGSPEAIADSIAAESAMYSDMVLGDFTDTYYNNTLKLLVGMRWLEEICTNYQYAFFADDDMYVNVKNLLEFAGNPENYPKTAKLTNASGLLSQDSALTGSKTDSMKSMPDETLFAGKVYNVPPLRQRLNTKWFVSLSEYPYHYYPPYIPAGAMLMSKRTVSDLYYGSSYTKEFRFDDVFLGIVARKMGIKPFHSDYFEIGRRTPRNSSSDHYKHQIAVHDFSPAEMEEAWSIEKLLWST